MSKYTITPWRTPSDLLLVRSQLYSSAQETQEDSRLHAVNRIMAWKLRGNLPHAVESTALLTDAILHHQQSSHNQQPSSSFSIRAVYSAAFTRFVTGFCDIGRSRERMLEPSSMLDIARKIGMPVEFVALRHEATHEELPALGRLVRATEEGLRWLWEVYWGRLREVEVEMEDEDEVEGSEGGLERLREVLKTWRGERRVALKKKKVNAGDVERLKSEEMKVARTCVDLVGSGVDGLESLVGVFVKDKLLFPSRRELEAPLDGAYLIWDGLLQAIFQQQNRFLAAFTKVLLAAIGDTSTGQSDQDAEKEALCLWLIHTTSGKSWANSAGQDLDAVRQEIVMWCCTNPGYWSHFLGVHLIKAGGPDFADIWEDMLEASRLGDGYVGQAMVVDVNPEDSESPDAEVLEDARDSRPETVDIAHEHRGSRRGVAAPNLPIGVVR